MSYKDRWFFIINNSVQSIYLLYLSLILATDLTSDDTQRRLSKKFITSVVYFLFKLIACIYLVFPLFGKLFARNNVYQQQPENQPTPELADYCSKDNILRAEEEDILHPCRQRLQLLESMVTELLNKPTTIPQEKEDMLLESLSRIKSIEYDLQKTKKVRIIRYLNNFKV